MAPNRFFRNSLFSLAGGAATALGSFACSVVVARTLGVEGTGAVALAVWITMTAVLAFDGGLPLTLARFLPDLDATGDTAGRDAMAAALLPRFLATIGAGAGGIAILGMVVDLEIARHWPVLVLMFTLQALGAFGLAELRGRQRFGTVAALGVASALVQVAAVTVGSLAWGTPGALLGYAAGAAIPAAATMARPRRATLDPALQTRALTYSRLVWFNAVLHAIVWSRIELLTLSYFWGEAAAGLFSVGLTLALLATQGPSLMMGGLLPLFSERHALGDRAGLERAFGAAFRFFTFLILPICLGSAAIAPVLVPAIFGASFAPAVPAATILLVATAWATVSAVQANVLYATENSGVYLKPTLVALVVTLVATVTVVPAYGVIGAAIARSVIQGGLSSVSFWFVARRMGIATPWGAACRLLVSALACALGARLVIAVFPTVSALPLAIVVGAVIYLAMVRITGALPRSDTVWIEARLQGMMPAPLGRRLAPLLRAVGQFGASR